MSETSNSLEMFMQAVNNVMEQSQNADLNLSVADTSATNSQDEIVIILQGQRKQPSRDTLHQLVGRSATFADLRSQLFRSTSARGVGVSVTLDGGRPTNYQETARIPGAVLDARQIRISYSVESGRNG